MKMVLAWNVQPMYTSLTQFVLGAHRAAGETQNERSIHRLYIPSKYHFHGYSQASPCGTRLQSGIRDARHLLRRSTWPTDARLQNAGRKADRHPCSNSPEQVA